MKLLLLSCRKATSLTEQKLLEGRLSYVREWQLLLHLNMCGACQRYAKQSMAVEQAFRQRLESENDLEVLSKEGEPPFLTPEMQEIILKRIKDS